MVQSIPIAGEEITPPPALKSHFFEPSDCPNTNVELKTLKINISEIALFEIKFHIQIQSSIIS